MPSERRLRRALFSVFDKTGLVQFARGLAAADIELVSTGGTAAVLRAAGLEVHEAGELTGFSDMLGGRVKTLHPAIHGAILARRGTDDVEIALRGITPIDVVTVNLYPFESAAANKGENESSLLEFIDIGGPAMARAAAKNWRDVVVVIDPADYGEIVAWVSQGGDVPMAVRRRLAAKAFARTAAYDTAISRWMATGTAGSAGGKAVPRPPPAVPGKPQSALDMAREPFPMIFAPHFQRVTELRYGENPHQRAAQYVEPGASDGTVASGRQLQGKPLTFNNLADADAAFTLVAAFSQPACVIVKHLNPSGVAVAEDTRAAYLRALACDSASAYGGIVAFNRPLQPTTAETMIGRQFIEVVVAPQIDPSTLAILSAKPNLRVLACGTPAGQSPSLDFRRLTGGLLVQDADPVRGLPADSSVVTRRELSSAERADLEFAWRVVQSVRSNAIVIARDGATVGIAGGQTSRVLAIRLAGLKARETEQDTAGAVLASDAFFPFRDNVDEAAGLGVRAIVQPGGSRRDTEVIAAAESHGMVMIFTHQRHFRH